MSDYNPWEENEVSVNAKGGTELIKRRLAAKIDPELAQHFQIIPSRVRQLHQDKIRIYWVHDLPQDPETSHLAQKSSRDRFHKIVFCGQWQYQHYKDILGIPVDDKVCVIDNAIEPIPAHEKPTDTINLIYTSTPQRGLHLLVPVFADLHIKYPNLRLHVCSSFGIYGAPDADQHFKDLLEACKTHPGIVYHGVKSNEEIRDLLQKMHIFAYPSVWEECNSLATIEAMSAGLVCVIPNYAGLACTTGKLAAMYQWNQDEMKHAAIFRAQLERVITSMDDPGRKKYNNFVKSYADFKYNLDRAVATWTMMMKGLLEQYPTPESRKGGERTDVFEYNPFGA